MNGARGLVSRLVDWLMCREALRDARRNGPAPEQRARLARARAALRLGDEALEQAARGDPGPTAAVALTLYREAATAALAGLPPDPAATDEEAPAARGRVALIERDPAATAAMDDHDVIADAHRAQARAADLTQRLARTADRERELLKQRATRIASVVALAFALVVAGMIVERALHPDLARQARWRTSSAHAGYLQHAVGFRPFENAANLFFHTNVEDAPWIEFDLERPTGVGSVEVVNRSDCCQDRAVPLVVEVSDDGTSWREVARRYERFYRWRAGFSRQAVRYVRLKALKNTSLHLAAVSIR